MAINTSNPSTAASFSKKDLIINTWALIPNATPAEIDNAYGARVNVSYNHIQQIINKQIRSDELSNQEIENALNPRIQRRLMTVLCSDFDDLTVTVTAPPRNPVVHHLKSRDITKKDALINLKFLYHNISISAAADVIGCCDNYAYRVFRHIEDDLELVTLGERLDEELLDLFTNEDLPETF